MLTSRILPQISRNMIVRNTSFRAGNVINGPPTRNVSFGTKVGCGILMVVCDVTIPFWILAHMEEYKAR